MSRYIDADALTWLVEEYKLAISPITEEQERDNRLPMQMLTEFENMIAEQPTVDAVPVPDGGIGELSDGYHTFNGLYYQRMMLFAALVKTYKDRAWKSRRHSDGEPCFGGGWFIVGIDTPQGGFTYHYEDKYFDLFDCVELPNGKEWDGHTEDDVTRLLTLADWFCADGERKDGETEQCNTYSLGKIEMPKGAIEQIIADGERKDGERRSDGE